jgi:hypothetical protein
MFRRRRQSRKLLRVARMLRELDAAAAQVRPEPRRVDRAAFGRV